MRPQVAQAKKPLISVWSMLGEGSRVVFQNSGGYIDRDSSKERVLFERVGNVSSLAVDTVLEVGFVRSGRAWRSCVASVSARWK